MTARSPLTFASYLFLTDNECEWGTRAVIVSESKRKILHTIFLDFPKEIGLITEGKKTSPFAGVSAESFNRFLALLSPEPDEAAKEYLSLRSRLLMYFQARESSDPQEMADDTLERLIRRFGETEYEILDIRAYALGIAKNVVMEDQRTVKIVPLDSQRLDLWSFHEQSQDTTESKHAQRKLDDCFQKCLSHLPAEMRELLLNYYSVERKPMDIRQELANELGLSLNALRVKIHRERSNLHHCIRHCVQERDIG
jgi:RNA polymerase sigma factor (sigma-70 family)